MSEPVAPRGPRHRFDVEIADLPDALIRVLTPFAVREARIVEVQHEIAAGAARAVVVTDGLEPEVAALLRLRLSAMPSVRAVTLRRLSLWDAEAYRAA